MRGKPVKWDEVKRYQKELQKTVKFIDTYFLKDQPFLCGNDISVADIQALCELMQLIAIGDESLYESNPKVKSWAERVKARLQPHFDECFQESVAKMKAGFETMKQAKL